MDTDVGHKTAPKAREPTGNHRKGAHPIPNGLYCVAVYNLHKKLFTAGQAIQSGKLLRVIFSKATLVALATAAGFPAVIIPLPRQKD